jgi:hypothetical protein
MRLGVWPAALLMAGWDGVLARFAGYDGERWILADDWHRNRCHKLRRSEADYRAMVETAPYGMRAEWFFEQLSFLRWVIVI